MGIRGAYAVGVAKISFATEKESADWRRSRERSGEKTTKGEEKAGKEGGEG